MKIQFLKPFLLAALMTTSVKADLIEVPIIGIDPVFLNDLGFSPNESNDLQGTAQQLQHFLEQQGYLLAKVVSHNGSLYVDLGRVEELKAEGLGALTQQTAVKYLKQAFEGKHPIEEDVDHAMMLIGDMPGVHNPAISFERSSESGLYDALLVAQETQNSGAISFDSPSRKAFQRNRVNIQQDFYHLFLGGDVLRFQGAKVTGDSDPDQQSVYLSYQAPVSDNGSYAEVSFADLESETSVRGGPTAVVTNTGFNVVPGAVTNHNFEGQAVSIAFGYPLHRAHDYSHYLIGNVDFTKDDTSGVGETDTWVVDLGWFETAHSYSGSTSDFSVSLGVGRTDSYIDGEDSNFSHLQIGYGLIQPLGALENNMEMRFEAFGQISSNDTPDARAFFLGGTDFLRGYQNATFEGVSGLASSFEVARGYAVQSDWVHQATSYLFLDYGYIENPSHRVNGSTKPSSDSLASTGVGGSLDFRSGLRLEGYVAKPLQKDSDGSTPSASGYVKVIWGW